MEKAKEKEKVTALSVAKQDMSRRTVGTIKEKEKAKKAKVKEKEKQESTGIATYAENRDARQGIAE